METCWSFLPLWAALLPLRMTSLLCPLTPAPPDQLSWSSPVDLLTRYGASAPRLFRAYPENLRVTAEPLCPPSLSWVWCPNLVGLWVGGAQWAVKVFCTARAVDWLLVLLQPPPCRGSPVYHSTALTLSPSPQSRLPSCTSPCSSPPPAAPWSSASWGSQGPVGDAVGCLFEPASLPSAPPLSRQPLGAAASAQISTVRALCCRWALWRSYAPALWDWPSTAGTSQA